MKTICYRLQILFLRNTGQTPRFHFSFADSNFWTTNMNSRYTQLDKYRLSSLDLQNPHPTGIDRRHKQLKKYSLSSLNQQSPHPTGIDRKQPNNAIGPNSINRASAQLFISMQKRVSDFQIQFRSFYLVKNWQRTLSVTYNIKTLMMMKLDWSYISHGGANKPGKGYYLWI